MPGDKWAQYAEPISGDKWAQYASEPEVEIPSTTTGFEASGQMAPKGDVEAALKGQAIGTGAILGAGVGIPALGPAAAAAVGPAARAVARPVGQFAAKHPIISNLLGSAAIAEARKIPYVGKLVPPGAEVLPWLRNLGGAAEGEAAAPAEPAPAPAAETPPSLPWRRQVDTISKEAVRGAGGAPEAPAAPAAGKPIYQRPQAAPTAPAPVETPPLAPITSSALSGVHYDAPSGTMTVQTKAGAMYRYGEVTPEEFTAFQKAESAGKAYQDIKNNHVMTGANYGEGWVTKKPGPSSAGPEDSTQKWQDNLSFLKKRQVPK